MRYRLYEIDRLDQPHARLRGADRGARRDLRGGLARARGRDRLGLDARRPRPRRWPWRCVFGPLRARVQLLVDSRFDRARYEGLRQGRALPRRAARRARGAGGDRRRCWREALGDPSLELFFWLPEERRPRRRSGPRRGRARRPRGRARTPVRRGALPARDRRARRVARRAPGPARRASIEAAGLAIEIARLRVEVRRRLAEVEESRARIVTAGYEERRRLERDLHDGAQQRLVSIGLALRHIQGQLPPPSRPADELNATVDEVLRRDRGVARAGPRSQAGRPRRRPRARAARARVALAAADQGLGHRGALRGPARDRRLLRRERGAGQRGQARARLRGQRPRRAAATAASSSPSATTGAAAPLPAAGSGLAGMSDRVAALGGTLSVDSPPGRGTVVTAELPCES